MKRIVCVAMLLAALCTAAPPALAVFVFRAGDTVYVDGKRYTWEEWKKIRDTYQQQPTPTAAVSVPSEAPRAASCITTIYYDEFPSQDERFQCTSGLGAVTREEILQRGWKVDLIEKIPTTPGQPAQSPRGLPLFLYKLVISR
ncbi:MAG: hypothetical protein E6H40_01555 [Betaproteobacteria bacterium]|nr:MAG: hypothetical protein E6H40_01555 [Betaproteobacteria bacterium]